MTATATVKLMRWGKTNTREPSKALERAREERERAQEMLEITRERTNEVEAIANALEEERVANHFAEALAVSWARRARLREQE
jgi:hypothetical protein